MQVLEDFDVADANRTAHEDVVQSPDDHVRALLPAAKSIFVARMREFLDDLSHRMPILRIEVACNHNRRILRIPAGIGEDLVELGELYAAGAAALEMQIVYDQRPAVEFQLCNQRQPAAEAALEEPPRWYVPMRFPESRLVLETQYSR